MEQVGDFSTKNYCSKLYLKRSFEAIVIIDRALRFVEVNPSACELFGLTREELIGQSLADFFTSPLNLEQQDITRVQIRHAQDSIKTVEYSEVKNLFPKYNLVV